jgi:hypothetical protein
MSRITIATAIALALLTGLVIGQLTAGGSPDLSSRSRPAEGRVELVRSFYDGMNRYLDDENAEFLSLLAPGFRDMHAPATDTGSADTLVAQLDTLRASAVAPRFEIEEINDLGQIIQVRVSNGLSAQLSAGGFSIDGFASDGALEFLQVEGNAIVSRWGQDDRIPRIASTLSETTPIGLPVVLNVESNLITLEPSAEWSSTGAESAWLVVETGAIVLEFSEGTHRLVSGDARLAPSGVRRVANRAAGTSSVWIVSVSRMNSPSALSVGMTASPGVTIDGRAWSSFVDLPASLAGIHIEVAKVVVPPGVNLEPSADALGHHVIVIDGSLAATVHHGDLLHVSDDSLATTERESATLSIGQAAASRPGAAISYRSTTGATLLLVTITLPD